MMLAALGAAAGDAIALQRALDAIDAAGIFTIVHTGNSTAGGAQPAEVMRLLAERAIPSAQGFEDRCVGRFRRMQDRLRTALQPGQYAAIEAAFRALPGAAIEALLARPSDQRLTVDGIRVLVCGGAPGHPQETVDPATPLARLERLREEAQAELVICGGAAAPFARHLSGTLFVSPGPLATHYAVVDTGTAPWRVEFRSPLASASGE